MESNSAQKYVGRNRPPRVQIEYDVEKYGATQRVELPFIMGVLADLKGARGPEDDLPLLEDRNFVEVDVDNFNKLMASTLPRVQTRVKNRITDDGNQLAVNLEFRHIDDFTPAGIAQQVEPLRKLLEMRKRLSEMLTLMDGRRQAEELLQKVIEDPTCLQASVPTASSSESFKNGNENEESGDE